MNEKYVPAEVEAAAQSHWSARNAYRVTEDANRPKFYACSMLPYPSGKLHMGHVRNYTINDMMARYLRMKGFNVLMPMGWDAFGLPAENAAMDNNVPPAQWTRANIADMKSQMQPLGLAFDWAREVATCDPSYYKWNQWFFLKMLDKGIAYKKTQIVNWDPVDQTVLANEQVVDGRGWRSGAIVEKREIPGYYLAITQYADELLAGVTDTTHRDYLEGWPERVRLMQEHWIGKSEGVRFAFTHDIRDASGALIQDGRMHVFTTRADTIKGVTFCAVAPEHPLATHAAAGNPELAAFIEACKQGGTTEAELALKDKEGMPTGLLVKHPLTDEHDPGVGGQLRAHDLRRRRRDGRARARRTRLRLCAEVPAADQAGGACRRPALRLPPVARLVCRQVPAASPSTAATTAACRTSAPWTPSPRRCRPRAWARRRPPGGCATGASAASATGARRSPSSIATPAPGSVPVPEKDLPVLLPEDLVPDGSGNPLNKCAAFLNVACPQCGQPARRETDTMDTFVDSAWYYMRYTCPDSDAAMVDARNDYWMPMDQYIGGIEHAVLHLLYARFWTKAMRDIGLVKFGEPFTKLFTQGMLLNECFYREDDAGKKRWFYPSEVDIRFDDKGHPVGATAKADGQPVMLGGIEKMSKSKNNVVEPRDIIAKFGADTARVFTMFAGPPDQSAAWSDSGAEGVFRFLRRLWAFGAKAAPRIAAAAAGFDGASRAATDLRRELHLLLRQVSHDYDRLQYNTVVSGAMKMLNAMDDATLADTPADAAVLKEA
jgi:leucyl-tRNA synthetase